MFGFKKSKGKDEELSRQYVRQVFAVGLESCRIIAEAIPTTTQGDVTFRKSMENNNNPFGEISGIMLCRCLGPRATEFVCRALVP